jgi:hypothetical protein
LFLWSAALQGRLLKLDEDKLSEDMDTHQQQQAVSNGAVAAAADGSSQLLTEQVKPGVNACMALTPVPAADITGA